MIDIDQLNELYSLYGFKTEEISNNTIVYTHNDGYFNNAEIVMLGAEAEQAEIYKKQYLEIGYSVHLVSYFSLFSANEGLFKGFFRIKQSKGRLLQEYKAYCDLQTKKLSGTGTELYYSYIQGDYCSENANTSEPLVDKLCNILTSKNAQLIILEAAAGFGKTCTSYEVIKNLASNTKDIVPLLAELSKNRKASIFKYVLLSEINNKFTTLSYELVTSEIKQGRIPLIIDGFDELLSRGISEEENQIGSKSNIENAQTMLDTIAQLFECNSQAKIMLTSRKSSIFTGEILDDWIENKLPDCTITRIEIAEPNIVSWIGTDKIDQLYDNGIEIDNISNPVLLSLLRYTPLEAFSTKFKNIDDILKEYFSLLLNREIERQQLRLEFDEQVSIMQKLAVYFVQLDISSEEPTFIKEIFSEILKPNIKLYLSRYHSDFSEIESRPTSEDEFLYKLVHHALLDRVSSQSNKIGFINDFIFGLFIADGVLSEAISKSELTSKYIDLALTAYSVKGKAGIEKLYRYLSESIITLPYEHQLNIDITFLHRFSKDYKDQTFNSFLFKSFIEFDKFKFNNCIFTSCTFECCKINPSVFYNCQFYNCRFFNIEIVAQAIQNCNLIFLGCNGFEELEIASKHIEIPIEENDSFEKIVLDQFWKIGYETAERRRSMTTLFKGTSSIHRAEISQAISSLLRKGILLQRAHCIELNMSKMNEVLKITGRDKQ